MHHSYDKERTSVPQPNTMESAISGPVFKAICRLLDGIEHGIIELIWPDGRCTVHGSGGQRVTVTLNNYLPLRSLLTGGHLSFAESYFDGHWKANNLQAMFDIVMSNESRFRQVLSGRFLSRLISLWNHWGNRNSRAGSRRNISFHYDLGNDFYKLWLDRSMTYSSGLYQTQSTTLEQAQQHKLSRIKELLAPKAGSRVLEIGCGWGALGHYLASNTDCEVHGVSLSKEQLDYAASWHSHPRFKTEYKDYRDIQGRYDHIVSIEMFEAVGERYWSTYFSQLDRLLGAQGTALLQIITIDEARFDRYRKQPDFIQRYIFPGGMLPTKSGLNRLISESGFSVQHVQWFGDSYAKTLADWKDRFERQLDRVRQLGYDERFIRTWRYYLSYCETGFLHQTTDVGLLLISRNPGNPIAVR